MDNELQIVREFTSRHPVDVAGLIRRLGVMYQEVPMEQSGSIEEDGFGYWINVNSNEGPQRRRFTAAHESAHYLLHRDLLGDQGRLHRDQLFGAAAALNSPDPFALSHEVQANKMAADILMPAQDVRRLYDRRVDNFRDLARRFDVSNKAMKIRLNNLGLRPTAD